MNIEINNETLSKLIDNANTFKEEKGSSETEDTLTAIKEEMTVNVNGKPASITFEVCDE